MTEKILVEIKPDTGEHLAEDKEIAKLKRVEQILPALDSGKQLVIDFSAVSSVTQSYANALFGVALSKHGVKALEMIEFRGCNEKVQNIISLVVDYHLAQRD